MIAIRAANEADFEDIWRIFHRVVARGNSCVFPPDATREDPRGYWLSADFKTFVAIIDGAVVGMYKLRPNSIGSRRAHIQRLLHGRSRIPGRGIGKAMGLHCLEEADATAIWPCSSTSWSAPTCPPSSSGSRSGLRSSARCPRRFSMPSWAWWTPM